MILYRLSSEALHFSRMHADHIINGCAYSSKGLSFYICEMNVVFCIHVYVAFVTEGYMVE